MTDGVDVPVESVPNFLIFDGTSCRMPGAIPTFLMEIMALFPKLRLSTCARKGDFADSFSDLFFLLFQYRL